MKFEIITIPDELPLNTERVVQVRIRVTPEFFGLVTTDWLFLKNGTSGKEIKLHKQTHFNRPYRSYIVSVPIHPHHTAKLTDETATLGLLAFNGPDPLSALVLGGEGSRAHYKREGDRYHFTGEIEKSF